MIRAVGTVALSVVGDIVCTRTLASTCSDRRAAGAFWLPGCGRLVTHASQRRGEIADQGLPSTNSNFCARGVQLEFFCNSFAGARATTLLCCGCSVGVGGTMIGPIRVAHRPQKRLSQQATLDLRGYSYGLRSDAAGVFAMCWFLGPQARGGKREHGATSDWDDANRGCPRNCERRAASVTATGKLGRPDAKLRPASQETCQHRHPTGGRGAPYGADFRSGDSTTERGPRSWLALKIG
jgi:hypothetical protein